MPIICSQCSQENPDQARYCTRCRADLRSKLRSQRYSNRASIFNASTLFSDSSPIPTPQQNTSLPRHLRFSMPSELQPFTSSGVQIPFSPQQQSSLSKENKEAFSPQSSSTREDQTVSSTQSSSYMEELLAFTRASQEFAPLEDTPADPPPAFQEGQLAFDTIPLSPTPSLADKYTPFPSNEHPVDLNETQEPKRFAFKPVSTIENKSLQTSGFKLPSQVAPQESLTLNLKPPPTLPKLPSSLSTTERLRSLRRAFAGYGSVITHHSWLFPANSTEATILRTAIAEKARQHNLNVKEVTLTERQQAPGIPENQRTYVQIKQNDATIFLFAASAGHDLYLSRTTILKLPVNPLRAIASGAILLVILIGPLFVQAIIAGIAGHWDVHTNPASFFFAGFVGLLCLFIYAPLLWIVFYGLFKTVHAWLTENDPLVFLRPSTLNDFHSDDIVLLEHAADTAIQEATKQLGLSDDRLTPPAQDYQPRRRIRRI